MNHRDWLRKQIERLKADLSLLSTNIMARVHTHDEYVVAVGSAKHMRFIINEYEAELKLKDDEDSVLDELDDDDDVEPPIKPKPKLRQSRPWGGGN